MSLRVEDSIALQPPCRRAYVLIPGGIEAAGGWDPGYDTPDYRAEMADWFEPLGVEWEWCPLTLRDVEAGIDRIQAEMAARPGGIAFNLCDGDEEDGFPGLSVVSSLERRQLPFTGAGSRFYAISSSKAAMYRCFVEAQVGAPQLMEVASPVDDVARVEDMVGYPCILKLDKGADGLGLDPTSVVRDADEFRAVAGRLWRDASFRRRGVLAQRFLSGREFTVLVVGSTSVPPGPKCYPPLEKVFNPDLEPHRRLMFHHCLDTPHATYRPATGDVAGMVADAALKAYLAVGGEGYGRVDLRLDEGSGLPGILEVNANCGLALHFPTITLGLDHAGVPFHHLVAEILTDAHCRHARSACAAPASRP